jgi:regulator of PEP synthase PpsR (kinase-PPPase family)
MESGAPTIFIVSGGIGSSGDQVARSVLAQYPDREVTTVIIPHVRNVAQVEDAIARTAVAEGAILYTLVDPALRKVLAERARARGVPAIDIMGGLMDHLTEVLLAVQGWKVANIPFVPSVPPGEPLQAVDSRRVIALDIDPAELSRIRDHRRRELGMPAGTDYTDAKAIWEESEQVQAIFKRRGYGRIDVTNKPVETLADEVTRMITRRLGDEARRA